MRHPIETQRPEDPVRRLRRGLDRYFAWEWYLQDVMTVLALVVICIAVLGASYWASTEQGVSIPIVVFVIFGTVVAISAGYMILRGERGYLEPLLPEFDDEAEPRMRTSTRQPQGASDPDDDGGSFFLGLAIGFAFLLLMCMTIGFPLDLDGWIEGMTGSSPGSRIARLASTIAALVGMIAFAGWHGIRTATGVMTTLAVLSILAEIARMHGLFH